MCWLRISCILYECKTKDFAWSWTFQPKSWHMCLFFWCLPSFLTIRFINYALAGPSITRGWLITSTTFSIIFNSKRQDSVVPEGIHITPRKVIGNSKGEGANWDLFVLHKSINQNWNFQRDGWVGRGRGLGSQEPLYVPLSHGRAVLK